MIRILVPLDGSPAAETAIQHAAAISHTFLAEIELLSVVGESKGDTVSHFDSVDWQLRQRQSQAYLARIADSLRSKGLTVSCQVREGEPAHEIVQRITEARIDLLVLSRYGLGHAQQFSCGGTAQKVISASAASVLLTDPASKFDARRGYERILVAVDGSQRSDWASTFAAVVAQSFNGSLHLLHVVEEPQLPVGTPVTGETRQMLSHIKRMARAQATSQLNQLALKLASNIEIESTIAVSKNVAATIESVVQQDGADLLVVAAQAAELYAPGRYGPTCESLLMHLRTPVLVLRSEPAELTSGSFRSVFLDETCADAV